MPSWRTLWLETQERIQLSLYPQGNMVTVIAVADRLDQGATPWLIDREQAILRGLEAALRAAVLPGS
jgi:hypothetical protein